MTMTKSINQKWNLQYIKFTRLDLITMWIHLIIKQSILILLSNYHKGVGVYDGAGALSSHTIPGHTFICHRVKAYHSVNSLGLQVIHFKLFYYYYFYTIARKVTIGYTIREGKIKHNPEVRMRQRFGRWHMSQKILRCYNRECRHDGSWKLIIDREGWQLKEVLKIWNNLKIVWNWKCTRWWEKHQKGQMELIHQTNYITISDHRDSDQ